MIINPETLHIFKATYNELNT